MLQFTLYAFFPLCAFFNFLLPSHNDMPNQMRCPVCGSDMRGGDLLSFQGLKAYRVCPDCKSKYTTDPETKKRALMIVFFALLTLALSTAGLLVGPPWGFLAFMAGTGLLIYVGYVLSKMTYIEYQD